MAVKRKQNGKPAKKRGRPSKHKVSAKAARASRRNGKLGGRPAKDPVGPLGIFLREKRVARGWSLPEAAKRCGVHPDTVWDWEKGLYMPRSSSMDKIVRGYELTLAEHLELKGIVSFETYLVPKARRSQPGLRPMSTLFQPREGKYNNQ